MVGKNFTIILIQVVFNFSKSDLLTLFWGDFLDFLLNPRVFPEVTQKHDLALVFSRNFH
jgi:hypothetical protein